MNTEPEDDPSSELSAEFLRALESMKNPATLGNAEQMEALSLAMFQAASAHAAAHPSPDQALEEAYDRQIESHDWLAALATLQRRADSAAARGEHHQVFRRNQQASQILSLIGKPEAACEMARHATAAARRCEGVPILIAVALQNESLLALKYGDAPAALALINAALVEIGTEPYAELSRARALVVRARCQLELGELREVESDLGQSEPILCRLGESLILAGAQAGLAGWHEVRARWHAAQAEISQAIENQRSAVLGRRIISAAPQVEAHVAAVSLAPALIYLGELLAQSGDPVGAAMAREEGEQLLSDLHL